MDAKPQLQLSNDYIYMNARDLENIKISEKKIQSTIRTHTPIKQTNNFST